MKTLISCVAAIGGMGLAAYALRDGCNPLIGLVQHCVGLLVSAFGMIGVIAALAARTKDKQ